VVGEGVVPQGLQAGGGVAESDVCDDTDTHSDGEFDVDGNVDVDECAASPGR
jgi:hypothetical protein